jgi:flavorubredoxin
MITLFQSEQHQNLWLDDFGHGLAVQANQHLILHEGMGMVLDPGGHKAFRQTVAQVASTIPLTRLQHIFLSHQDPDIVAAINGWLMTTDADAWCSRLWVRFVPHFGVDQMVAHRLKPIPDEGMVLQLGSCPLLILPAHFLHSAGNFHVYDPHSRILYSGDLGASLLLDYRMVQDFQAHIPYMLEFHQRYMSSNAALRRWVRLVRQLDIDTIAPQHGAIFRGKQLVQTFLDWCENLDCGLDLLPEYPLPG